MSLFYQKKDGWMLGAKQLMPLYEDFKLESFLCAKSIRQIPCTRSSKLKHPRQKRKWHLQGPYREMDKHDKLRY